MSTISRDDLAALIQGFGEQISESRARDRDAAAELRDAAAAEAKADREQQSANLQHVIKTMSRGSFSKSDYSTREKVDSQYTIQRSNSRLSHFAYYVSNLLLRIAKGS